MTRAEAIAEIKERIKATEYIDGSYVDSVNIEALDMANEALNREQKKYDAICNELVALKSNLNEPIEVAMAYEKSIAIVRKYARGEDE